MVRLQNNLVNWYWQIDSDSSRFVLCLSKDIEFPTLFCRQQLALNSALPIAFTTEDAEVYSAFRDLLSLSKLDQQQQFTLAVNATVGCNYLTPCATKSWLFMPMNNQELGLGQQVSFKCGDVVETQSMSPGYYLVLDSDEHTSTIILLSEQQQVDTNRVFNQGQVVKVHNDRLDKQISIADLAL